MNWLSADAPTTTQNVYGLPTVGGGDSMNSLAVDTHGISSCVVDQKRFHRTSMNPISAHFSSSNSRSPDTVF